VNNPLALPLGGEIRTSISQPCRIFVVSKSIAQTLAQNGGPVIL
jgi:hypothetical protein